MPAESQPADTERASRPDHESAASAAPGRPSEESQREEIERLLAHIESADVTFIRSGREYTAEEAAEHLRQKLAVAGDRVQTLEQFIEHIASRSSLTGEPYQVKLPDGTTLEAREWLEGGIRD